MLSHSDREVRERERERKKTVDSDGKTIHNKPNILICLWPMFQDFFAVTNRAANYGKILMDQLGSTATGLDLD